MPYIALILAHTIWGIHFVVSKITLQEFPIFTLAFFRFAFASLFLAPFFLAQTRKSLPAGRQVKIKPKDLPKLVSAGIFIITLNIAFFFSGIKLTDATSASVITLIIPILSVILGWWFLKEKVFLINILGVIVGLLGAIVIIGLPDPTKILGNFLILLASVSFVIGAVFSRQMLKKYPSLTVTAFAFLVGLVTFFPMAAYEYIQNPGWTDKVTILGIFGVTFMVLLSSISAYFLFEWGLAKTSLVRADLFQYIEPLWATTLAVLILGELISVPLIVGAILIILGVYLGTLAKEPHHRHHKQHRL